METKEFWEKTKKWNTDSIAWHRRSIEWNENQIRQLEQMNELADKAIAAEMENHVRED